MSNRHIIDRNLENKTFLRFYFPPEAEGNRTVVTMPFFENPQIKETKRARYKRYNLLGRSSNLYAYLGADSRKLTLNFSITLPHLMEEHRLAILSGKYVNTIQGDRTISDIKNDFKSPTSVPRPDRGVQSILNNFMTLEGLQRSARTAINGTDWGKSLVGKEGAENELERIKDVYDVGPGFGDFIANAVGAFNKGIDFIKTFNPIHYSPLLFPEPFSPTADDSLPATQRAERQDRSTFKLSVKAIEVILYWVNIIRSSVINNARNPIKGPPVVRLSHGTLYQNIPCICTDYTIEFKEDWGYDVHTLTPRKINVRMNLEELRAGDFGQFDPTVNNMSARDNIAGWESVISSPNTMDPGWL
jgi:hypothetical protein